MTTELREALSLVSKGNHERVRHPMYSAIWINLAATPFLIHNWIAGMGGLVSFGIMFFTRVPAKESIMLQEFFDTYEVYAARTRRLRPKNQPYYRNKQNCT